MHAVMHLAELKRQTTELECKGAMNPKYNLKTLRSVDLTAVKGDVFSQTQPSFKYFSRGYRKKVANLPKTQGAHGRSQPNMQSPYLYFRIGVN